MRLQSNSKKEKQLNLKQYAQLINKFIKNNNSRIGLSVQTMKKI